MEGIAEVRLRTEEEPLLPPVPPGERHIHWRGVVPTQKWMNFYTKVLSRFVSITDFKIEVSFDVKIEREQADAKAAETKAALKELGLDDNVAS